MPAFCEIECLDALKTGCLIEKRDTLLRLADAVQLAGAGNLACEGPRAASSLLTAVLGETSLSHLTATPVGDLYPFQ